MELNQIRYFLEVSKTLHYGKAAENLHVTTQPLSLQIKKLEAELGVELLSRTTRSVSLTAEGAAFREYARRGIAELEAGAQLVRRMGEGLAGQLRVGYNEYMTFRAFPVLIEEFRRRYPGVEILLNAFSQGISEELGSVMDGKVDVCVGWLLEEPPAEVSTKLLYRDGAFVALPRRHRLAACDAVSMQDLRDEPFVTYSAHEEDDYLRKVCLAAGFQPSVIAHANSYLAALGLVEAGFGVTFANESLSGIMDDYIEYRRLSDTPFVNDVCVYWRADNDSATVRNFVDVAARSARAAQRR